ncbi:MAG TPA: HEAT repeat domain-containing protein [Polyangiaceae bacterium]
MTHERYPLEIRLEAAMTLVEMKPRRGRRVGIQGSDEFPGLIDALAHLPPSDRGRILSRLVPKLEAAMLQSPPARVLGKPPPPDPSFPYKDAAFALLTHDGAGVLAKEALRQRLRDALIAWSMTNFSERMDESSQLYGMEQVLREFKADGARGLPELIRPGAAKIDRMSELVADFGDPGTKALASQRLVAVASYVASDAWIQEKAPMVSEANRQTKLNPSPDQFKAQLKQYQEEELLRVFTSMKKVGGTAAVDYLLKFALEKSYPPKQRATALASLEGNLDRSNPAHVDTVLSLASDPDTPDLVRDIALRRVGDMPRASVVDRLYGLFKADNWKVRWVAAELVLKMSKTEQVPEFFRKLEQAENMDITEPLRYGALLGDMEGSPDPQTLVLHYVGPENPVQARLCALGYYYQRGVKSELDKIQPYLNDRTKVPGCKEHAKDCEWKCTISQGDQQESKDITTVGEFVQYCVKPAMEGRAQPVGKEHKTR